MRFVSTDLVSSSLISFSHAHCMLLSCPRARRGRPLLARARRLLHLTGPRPRRLHLTGPHRNRPCQTSLAGKKDTRNKMWLRAGRTASGGRAWWRRSGWRQRPCEMQGNVRHRRPRVVDTEPTRARSGHERARSGRGRPQGRRRPRLRPCPPG
jgi:hypothetical protein